MKRNAYFEIFERDSGTYIRKIPAVDGGEDLKYEDVAGYLTDKKINFETVELNKFTQSDLEEMCLSTDKLLPCSEYLKIEIDPNGLVARGRFYPPVKDGGKLDKNNILDLLEQAGVTYGIINKNIEIFCIARLYCTDILLAKGKKPRHGTDARIEYNFNYEKTSKPALREDGSVDFHNLDMFESVKEGELLATLIPEDAGEPGTDVCGNVVHPRKVKRARLRYGKNITLSEDGSQIFSDVSGHVALAGDMVFVSNVYEVPADVGPSTGDIEYDGSVEVKGNVITGFTVKASGNITVDGVVEGATLEAGGNIVLKRGIQGMGKGILNASGSVYSKFIENSTVSAGATVMTDAIMHSKVTASKEIKVQGKRGLITGGEVRSGTVIEAINVGSTMGTNTSLEVGIDPKIMDRYHEVEAERKKLEENIDTTKKNAVLLKRMLKETGSLPEDKIVQLKSFVENLKVMEERYKELSEESIDLETLLEDRNEGKVIVHNIAYPGVKLTVASAVTFIRTVTQHSRFVRDGADVRVKGI